MAPLLTIVVPAYNVAAYLSRGLSSYDDERFVGLLEVIVVNDGSTDETPRIALDFVERRPQVFRLISQENGGHGAAVNTGIENATGKYFRIVDGDDWVSTDGLADLLTNLAATESDLVIDVKQEVDLSTGKTQLFPIPPLVPFATEMPFVEVCGLHDLAPFMMIHTLTVRTDYLRELRIHLLEHTYYEDLEYVLKTIIQASTVAFLNINVYQYLVGNAGQSVADDNYVKHWDDHSRVTEELLAYYEALLPTLDRPRQRYFAYRLTLLINTHYNIALIFDKDRKRGLKRAQAFRRFLRDSYPELARQTDKRYKSALLLHYLGIDSQARLNKLG